MKATAWSFARRNPAGALVLTAFTLALLAAIVYDIRADLIRAGWGIIYGCALWGAIDLARRFQRWRNRTEEAA